jgi:hypothetical protein
MLHPRDLDRAVQLVTADLSHRCPRVAWIAGLFAASVAAIGGCASVKPPASVVVEDGGTGSGGSLGVIVVDGSSDAAPGFGGAHGGGGGSSGATDGAAEVDAGIDESRDAATDAGNPTGGCTVIPTPVSPPDLLALEAFPGARARISVAARGARSAAVTFTWEVLWTGQSPMVPVPTTAIDAAGSIIEFPVEHEGDYRITPRVAGDPTCPIVTMYGSAQRAVFLLRTTVAGLLVHEDRLNLHALDPQDRASISLGASVGTRLAPVRADGTALPSYVRVSHAGSELRIDGDTSHGSLTAQLVPGTSYDVLIVPNEDLAPVLFTGTPAMLQAQTMVVDQGIPILAGVRDGANHPLAGARMIMRQGQLPSTVGASDASGLMTLWARPGTLTASLVPPPGSGLPQASVGLGTDATGGAGVVLDQSGQLNVQMTWDAVTMAPATIDVRGPDGTTRLAGAEVRATSRASGSTPATAPVGTLTAQVGAGPVRSLRAVGSTDIQVVADANGVATFPALPVGDLTLTVVPPASVDSGSGASDVAVTSLPVTVASAGLTQMVTMARKVVLSGLVLPVADTAGALITGIDTSITAPGRVATATVGADGSYSLTVDPARAYQLIVDPAPGASVARATLGMVTSGAADTTVSTRTLPTGHAVTGTVTRTAMQSVAGARVQVFCPSWSAQCLNASFALADVVTDQNGNFQLTLAEPPAP